MLTIKREEEAPEDFFDRSLINLYNTYYYYSTLLTHSSQITNEARERAGSAVQFHYYH